MYMPVNSRAFMIKHEWIITNNLTFIWHMSCLWSRNWWRGQFRSYFGSFLSICSIIWQDYDHSRSPPVESCQINFIELETKVLEQVPDGIRIISPPYRHPEIDKIGNVKDWIFLSDFWLIDTKNYVMILSVVHGSFLWF